MDSQASRKTILYVETTSTEAISMIENLTKVEAARRLLDDCSLLEYEEVNDSVQALRDLERTIRSKIRTTVLQPEPKRVSQHLIERIRCEVRREIDNEGSIL